VKREENNGSSLLNENYNSKISRRMGTQKYPHVLNGNCFKIKLEGFARY
jgi:hypothetical protein